MKRSRDAGRPSGSADAPIELSDDDEPEPEPAARPSTDAPSRRSWRFGSGPPLVKLSAPRGLLDRRIFMQVEAVAQQNNCLGCGGKGLAAAVAAFGPPPQSGYGCPYRRRRRLPEDRDVCVPEDRPAPGSVEARHPPTFPSRWPTVVCLYGQWAKGPAGKYERHIAPPGGGKDDARQREAWFGECLRRLGARQGAMRFASIAFPYQIGCGLAGGCWAAYEAMLRAFAAEHVDIRVVIAARPEDLLGARDAREFAAACEQPLHPGGTGLRRRDGGIEVD